MKRSKSELALEALLNVLDYLDHHKIQGRMLFCGVSVNLVLLAIKYVTPELILIIEALK
jgi:hypothetical protein